jgi:hypothetical protein
VVTARMPGYSSPVVIRKAHFDGSDPEFVQPAAHICLLFPPRIPLRENNNGGARVSSREKLRVDAIIFRPRRRDSARKREDVVIVQRIVVSYSRCIPFVAMRERVLDESFEESARVRIVRNAADVFESPGKGQRPAIRLLRPPHVFVASYFLFEQSHNGQTIQPCVAAESNPRSVSGNNREVKRDNQRPNDASCVSSRARLRWRALRQSNEYGKLNLWLLRLLSQSLCSCSG